MRSLKLSEVLLEIGVGGADAFGAFDEGFAIGEEAGDGEGHGDAVVVKGGDGGTVEFGTADDFHAVVEFGDGDAHESEVGGDGGDAVGFFDAEFGGVFDEGFALGEGGGDGEDGEFVDDVGDFRSADGGAL